MSSKKSGKSFADALLSADVSEPQTSSSKSKVSKRKSFKFERDLKTPSDRKKSSHSKPNSKSHHKKTNTLSPPAGKKYTINSLLNIERQISNLDKDEEMKSLSADESANPSSSTTFDRSKYGSSSVSSGKKTDNKQLLKMLKAEEESKKKALMLQEVNEEHLLFNLKLDDEEQSEDIDTPEEKVPLSRLVLLISIRYPAIICIL